MNWPKGIYQLKEATFSCNGYISFSREFLHESARINYGIFVNNYGTFTGFRTFRRPKLLEASSKVFLLNMKDRFTLINQF